MNQPTDDLSDLWASPTSPSHETYVPRSRPPWPGYEPPAVQLARLQEGQAYLRQLVQTDVDRLQVVTQRIQHLDTRVRALEEWRVKATETLSQSLPILEQYKRMRDRIRWLKDVINYGAAAVTIYLAFFGKVGWADALHALAKILGAG